MQFAIRHFANAYKLPSSSFFVVSTAIALGRIKKLKIGVEWQ